ncbi:MAG: CCA tRNA nucleotidyltransferase [Candidatus Paceibacterota bacterium]|jgi:poly(A) polymerase/tRNA nucleotidyltransferase (CCA-adding enzyme)
MKHLFKIPKSVSHVTETLEKAGFEAYVVGGCVRDLINGKKPRDWDATTDARPEQIIALFANTFYENEYGTVGVVNEEEPDETLKIVEVTPYRTEAAYSDFRRPDKVVFSNNIGDDLSRRDFTINSIAYNISKGQIVDPYNGQDDIKDRVVRTVGEPEDRFGEDALRMLRAIRFSTELGFTIEPRTEKAIQNNAFLLEKISKERIRDEFVKIIMSDKPMYGIALANKLGVLKYVSPETETGLHVKQNGDHVYDVWEHNLRAVQHSADNKWPLHVRLAALFHDVSKPETRRWSEEKKDFTFYGHDVVGGRVAKKIMERLKFPVKLTETVSKLVRYHLFFSDIDKITLSAVRRIVKNVGPENVWDLMKVRACDRIGMGRPKEKPYRLRKYESMIEEATRAPVSVGMLKTDGQKIMEVTHETPGPRLGWMLHALLEEVLDNPELNTVEYLNKRTLELSKMSDIELKKLGEEGREKKEQEEEKEVGEIRKRHWVK